MRALLLDIVVAADREQRGLGVFLLLRLDDVADVDQLVLPSVQRDDLSRVVLKQIRDEAAGHRRDDLLAQWRIGHDAVVDRVAAGLLVIGDDLFDRDVFLFGGALGPPHGRGRRRGVGDVGPPQSSRRRQSRGTAKQRTPAQLAHRRLLPRCPLINAGASWSFSFRSAPNVGAVL
jgi:hypothetical protein